MRLSHCFRLVVRFWIIVTRIFFRGIFCGIFIRGGLSGFLLVICECIRVRFTIFIFFIIWLGGFFWAILLLSWHFLWLLSLVFSRDLNEEHYNLFAFSFFINQSRCLVQEQWVISLLLLHCQTLLQSIIFFESIWSTSWVSSRTCLRFLLNSYSAWLIWPEGSLLYASESL